MVRFKSRRRLLLPTLLLLLTVYRFTILSVDDTSDGQNHPRGDKKFATPLEWFEEEGLLNGVGESNENLFNDDWLDENLHRLSHWDFPHTEWEVYVDNHVRHEDVQSMLQRTSCRILEIGGGVGAFARSLLRSYDSISNYTSIDQSDKAVSLSRIANNKDARFRAFAASMEDSKAMRTTIATAEGLSPASYDIVIMSGCLCYMRNERFVQTALENALTELRVGGVVIASVLPRTKEAMRSCETIVPLSMLERISKALQYEIVTTDDMSEWGTGNQEDRYLVILRKIG